MDSAGIEGNGPSLHPAISADGRHVAFQSLADDLVSNDWNFASDAFLRDRMDCAGSAMTYCTAKLSSSGCTPRVGSAGIPSATASSGFLVAAAQVEAGKPGVLFYGVGGRAAGLDAGLVPGPGLPQRHGMDLHPLFHPLHLVCLVPATWFALFAGIVLRARFELGYWPHPQRGDFFGDDFEWSPLEPMTFEVHAFLLSFAWPAAVLAVLASPVVLGVLVLRGWEGARARFALAYVLGCALCGALWLADPWGLWDWFLD